MQREGGVDNAWRLLARRDQRWPGFRRWPDDVADPPDTGWITWLLLGGRGAGKTRAGAEWVRHVAAQGPVRIALVAEAYADAREVMIDGLSGLGHIGDPAARPSYQSSRRRLVWPNGAMGYCFSSEDPEGLRGYQFDAAWADPNIDFVGVDNYLPLADWRDGVDHLDALETDSVYDLGYLKGNIQSGERFDWYYASDADRAAQLRTPITDGAYGEPWVWRAKDFFNWWSSAHHDRPGGVRNASPTAWVPLSKPIRFTEIGCPAIDKGANQPNVFVDAKSTESAIPHFSNGARDDLMQRRFLEALLSFWADGANNPVSSVYGGPMVDASRAYVYAWDARPWPFFPARGDVWGDAANWARGHWLSGRLGRAPLDTLVTALAAEAGAEVDAGRLNGVLAGYVVDRPMSAREAIDPLMDVFQFDMAETSTSLKFFPRDRGAVAAFATASLVQGKDEAFTARLAQVDDLPGAFRLIYLDEGADYAPAAAEAKEPGRDEVRVAGAELAAVMGSAEAEARARAILADAHVMRETMSFALPPSKLALEPGDVIDVTFGDVARTLRITDISDTAARTIDAVRTAPAVYDAPPGASVFTAPEAAEVFAAPVWSFLDLPLLSGDDDGRPRLAAFSEPWAGAALYREETFAASAATRAIMGKLDEALPPGVSGRWDEGAIRIRLYYGSLSSRSREEVLAGANALAIETAAGWEVMQFADAVLQSDGAWRLAGLLRGQAGTEAMAAAGASDGARIVLLTPALARISVPAELRTLALDWRAGPLDAAPTDDAFRVQTIKWTNRAATPLSPVHAKVDETSGGRRVTWTRRTRTGGDDWVSEDAPLGELNERYRIEVVVGGEIVRTGETTSPVFDYDDAQAASDGAALAGIGAVTFRIAQLSDAVGPGDWTEVVG